MKTTSTLERAKDRIKVLLSEPVLKQAPENIAVNAPVAITQIAWQNELNGILLGLGLADKRIIKLPMTDQQMKAIKTAIK